MLKQYTCACECAHIPEWDGTMGLQYLCMSVKSLLAALLLWIDALMSFGVRDVTSGLLRNRLTALCVLDALF